MTDEKQIWHSAQTMIKAHSSRAGSICAETAERWKRRGDQEAVDIWLRILQAVRKLETEMLNR